MSLKEQYLKAIVDFLVKEQEADAETIHSLYDDGEYSLSEDQLTVIFPGGLGTMFKAIYLVDGSKIIKEVSLHEKSTLDPEDAWVELT